MLISILLTLTTDQPATLPPAVGRANYANVLRLLGELDPVLAKSTHDGDGPKPITCSSLQNVRYGKSGMEVAPGTDYYVRVTGLTPPVSQALHQVLKDKLQDTQQDTPPFLWRIDDHTFRVSAMTCDPTLNPWTGQTTYEQLAATQLLRSDSLPRQVTLDFASPTAFKSKEINIPMPMPGLVFGSLVERWNAFSPVTLSPDMRRYGEEMVSLFRYKLETRSVEQKNSFKPGADESTENPSANPRARTQNQKAFRIGAIGQAT